MSSWPLLVRISARLVASGTSHSPACPPCLENSLHDDVHLVSRCPGELGQQQLRGSRRADTARKKSVHKTDQAPTLFRLHAVALLNDAFEQCKQKN
eukprot:scaffold1401_cov21-Tisochrysis_lutea.AAC.1